MSQPTEWNELELRLHTMPSHMTSEASLNYAVVAEWVQHPVATL